MSVQSQTRTESSLRIRTYDELPSSADFNSTIESTNVPAVFKSCVSGWKAFSKWNPSNGGLDYLQERVGSCVVEAMLSQSAPAFYGDLRSHERVPLPFSEFVGFCKQRMRKSNVVVTTGSCDLERSGILEPGSSSGHLPRDDDPGQIYLAQVPIMHFENEDKAQLEALKEDIDKPLFLDDRLLASVNLWMNSARARSSTHCDPHHNLLCLVSGCKQVVLWPPSASPMLYLMPIYGEASNHSLISLENPDFSVYPRAKCLMEYSQKVVLHAGDALFIPEGWFHQVDSDDLTIAVNFWWRSSIMLAMSEHMDAYYLRRLLRRLADKEMNEILCQADAPSAKIENTTGTCELLGKREVDSSCSKPDMTCEKKDFKGKELEQRNVLHELEPTAIHVLHSLVSLVHDRINVADSGELVQSASTTNSATRTEVRNTKATTTHLLDVQDDEVAKILWSLEPLTLQNVFLTMAHNFPRTLEALVLHLLSPVAAEVLTRKFDELDRLITGEERNKFYQVFYGAFDDQFSAMDAILNGKESFARQTFNSVLDKYLGVNCAGSIRALR